MPAEGRETPPQHKQKGMYVDEEAHALRTRPQKGDRMIHGKESKRKRRQGPTPYEEVMDFISRQRAWDDSVGPHEIVDEEGNVDTVTITSGATYKGPVQGVEAARRPSIDELSLKARKLFFGLQNHDREETDALKQTQPKVHGTKPLIPGVHFDPHASIFPGTHEEGVQWGNLKRATDIIRSVVKRK